MTPDRARRLAADQVPGVTWGAAGEGTITLAAFFPDGSGASVVLPAMSTNHLFDWSEGRTVRNEAVRLADAWALGVLR